MGSGFGMRRNGPMKFPTDSVGALTKPTPEGEHHETRPHCHSLARIRLRATRLGPNDHGNESLEDEMRGLCRAGRVVPTSPRLLSGRGR